MLTVLLGRELGPPRFLCLKLFILDQAKVEGVRKSMDFVQLIHGSLLIVLNVFLANAFLASMKLAKFFNRLWVAQVFLPVVFLTSAIPPDSVPRFRGNPRGPASSGVLGFEI